MSRGLSLYLDGLRAAAALVVLFSHFAYPRFTNGDFAVVRTLDVGSDAVILFFVLSGFVIAFARHTKDATWKSFAFSRATRLYSVAIPAVALTLAFDAIGKAADPASYDGWWYSAVPAVVTAPVSLLFANEWGPIGVRFGTNGPWWSLSYEVAYYALFGVFVYLRGARRWAVLGAAAVIFGPKVLALMPAWIFGAVVYRRLQTSCGRVATEGGAAESTLVAAAIAVGSVLAYGLCLAADIPGALAILTRFGFGSANVASLRFSDEFLWDALIGGLFAAHIFAMGILLRASGSVGTLGRPIRWLAGASFSIYLVHYPALQFIHALLPQGAPYRDFVLLAGTIAICLAFAQAFERPLQAIRGHLCRVGEPFIGPFGRASEAGKRP